MTQIVLPYGSNVNVISLFDQNSPPVSLPGQFPVANLSCFGGSRSLNPLFRDPFNPVFTNPLNYGLSLPAGPAYRIFPDTTKAQTLAGRTDYRAIFLRCSPKSSSLITTPTLWFDQASFATMSVGLDTIGADGTIQTINPAGTTAPVGVSFSSPTEEAPLSLPSIPVGGAFPIWIRRVVAPLALNTAFTYDNFELFLKDSITGTIFKFLFFHSYRVGIDSMTVTNPKGIDGIDVSGDVFTISTFAAGVAQDPIGSGRGQVLVYISVPVTYPWWQGDMNPEPTLGVIQQGGMTLVDVAKATGATGVINWTFAPTQTGHHHIVFDVAELRTEIDVEVSGIATQN